MANPKPSDHKLSEWLAEDDVSNLPPVSEWLRLWMAAERRVSRSVDTRKLAGLVNYQSYAYSPEAARVFTLKTYWVDAEAGALLDAPGLSEDMKSSFVRVQDGKTQVRIMVHPESESLYESVTRNAERGPDIQATPTASSRTLLAWEKEGCPFFAKVSLDAEIGRLKRVIPIPEMVRSVVTTRILDSMENRLPETFNYLPEVLGFSSTQNAADSGMLVRNVHPVQREKGTYFIPLFSLYAAAPNGGPPLLARMIQESGLAPLTFVERYFLEPFAREWVKLALQGVTMAPHAQNVLVGVGPDGLPSGTFIHRDFEAFNFDFDYLSSVGKPVEADMPVVTSWELDYNQDPGSHQRKLAKLDAFFVGGFLFNLQKEIPTWQQRGWISQQPSFLRADQLERSLASALEQAFREESGVHMDLQGTVAYVAQAVAIARDALVKQPSPRAP